MCSGCRACAPAVRRPPPEHSQARALLSGLDVVDRPSQSPDLNPIEFCFMDMANLIDGLDWGCTGSDVESALKALVNVAWGQVPGTRICAEIRALPDRMRAVHRQPHRLQQYRGDAQGDAAQQAAGAASASHGDVQHAMGESVRSAAWAEESDLIRTRWRLYLRQSRQQRRTLPCPLRGQRDACRGRESLCAPCAAANSPCTSDRKFLPGAAATATTN